MANCENIQGKIALITGASSGIGEACAQELARLGVHLIIAARRLHRMQQLAQQLMQDYKINVLPLELDISNREEVNAKLATLDSNWASIDILVNNAGLALGSLPVHQGNVEDWNTMIDTNIKGTLYVLKVVLPSMVARNSGHIVNISSVAGHEYYPLGNVYSATKHAVFALSKSLRLDLSGLAIRVSDIAPGAVETEFSEKRWGDKEKARKFYADFTPLVAADIADAVSYCVTRKAHVNVDSMLIFPVDQASANCLHRQGESNIGGGGMLGGFRD